MDDTDPPRTPGEDDSPRARRPAGQDPAKRDQILNGAQEIFSRLGFDAASMNDITREAGVSKSTIYVYFASKDELFEALVARERERLFGMMLEQLDRPGPVEDVLFAYGCFLARKLCSDKVISAHRIVIGVTERKPELGQRFYESGGQRGMTVLRRYLDAQVAAGTLDIADTELAAYQLVELCLAGMFRRRLLSHLPDEPTEAQIERVVGAGLEMFLSRYRRPV